MRALTLHHQLAQAHKIFDACNVNCTDFYEQHESREYAAYSFNVGHRRVLFRAGKKTPTKVGFFVVLWKRSDHGGTEPYDKEDGIDTVIIAVEERDFSGYFIFPQSVLVEKRIFSTNKTDGKRGIRIYPSWSTPTSAQAIKTQQWQCQYFVDSSKTSIPDTAEVLALWTNR